MGKYDPLVNAMSQPPLFPAWSRVNPQISPIRLSLMKSPLLSVSYWVYVTMLSWQTTLDAPSLIFLPPAGTCSLNQNYGYAFGRRRPLAAKILRDLRIHW